MATSSLVRQTINLSEEQKAQLKAILNTDNFNIYYTKVPNCPSYSSYITYNIELVVHSESYGDQVIYHGSASQLPGCCGVQVMHNASSSKRSQGLGTWMHKFRMDFAYSQGYTIAICTDVVEQIATHKILEKFKWHKLLQFRNRRTHNDVDLFVVNLTKDKFRFSFYDSKPPVEPVKVSS